MERTEVARTLAEVETLQQDTRRSLQSFWFPLLVFGALTLLSAPLFEVRDGSVVALYWGVAGTAGGIATAFHYARRERALGVCRPATPYMVVAVGIILGAFVLPMLVTGDLESVVSSFAVAAGYLCFAFIERDARIAAIAVVLAVVPLATLAVVPGSAGLVTALVTGSVLVASGLAFRRTQVATPRLPG